MKKKIKELYKKIWSKPDIYWNDLNTKTKDKKLNEIKKEILEIIYICIIAATFVFFIYFTLGIQNLSHVDGTGFIFFITTIIFILLVFAILHTNNHYKLHSHQYQAKNSQQQHV